MSEAALNTLGTIQGYQLLQELNSGAFSRVYLAEKDGHQFAIKILSGVNSAEKEVFFKGEIKALSRLSHPNLATVVEAGMEGDSYFVVMELISGRPLSEILRERRVFGKEWQDFIVGIAGALAEVHRHDLVHLDVSPQNIIVTKTGRPVLIDFGLTRPVGESSHAFLGTPKYASPEQMGIIPESLSPSSDLFSLGVIAFECLVGQSPFGSEDPNVILESHRRRILGNVTAMEGKTHPTLIAIIRKLLSPLPGARYRSAAGLIHDLIHFETLPKIGNEPNLGTKDNVIRASVQLPIIGREQELALLQNDWARFTQSRSGRFWLIQGEAGSGKSKIVSELLSRLCHEPVAALYAKCDKLESIPFSAFRELIQCLVSRAQTLPDSERGQEIELINVCLQGDHRLLRGFSRHLQLVSPESAANGAVDASNQQLYSALTNFFLEYANRGRNLLLIIDDVQWLDEESFGVLDRLGDAIAKASICVVGISRNDEESRAKLARFVKIAGSDLRARIDVPSLTGADSDRLIAKVFNVGEVDAPLLDFIRARAKGNPFSLIQFTRAVMESGIVSTRDGQVTASAEDLSMLDVPQDVVDLIQGRLAHLPNTTVRVLQFASLIGSRFEPELLASATGLTRSQLDSELQPALGDALIEAELSGDFRFLHDRIKEAVLRSVATDQAQPIHLEIVRALRGNPAESPEYYFALANHYRHCRDLADREEIFQASLEAGEIAIRFGAWPQGHDLLGYAAELASSPGWEVPDEQLLRLYTHFGIASRETGRYIEAKNHFDRAIRLTQDPLTQARLHANIAAVLEQQGIFDDSIVVARKGFELLNCPIPSSLFVMFVTGLLNWALGTFLEWVRIGAASAKGRNLEKRRALADLYRTALFSSIFSGRIGLYLWLQGRALINYHFLGHVRETFEGRGNFAITLALVGLVGRSRKLGQKNLDAAIRSGDQGSIAFSRMYLHNIAEFTGEHRKAVEYFERASATDIKLLNSYFECIFINGWAWSLVWRGRASASLHPLELAERRAQRYPYDPLQNLFWQGSKALAFTLLGRYSEAQDTLGQCEKTLLDYEKFGQFPMRFAYAGWVLANLREQGEFGERAEATLRMYEKHAPPARSIIHPYKVHVAFRAYMCLERHLRNPGNATLNRELQKAIKDLETVATLPTWRSHLEVIKAAYRRNQNDPLAALKLVEAGYRHAVEADSIWGQIEALSEKARILEILGRDFKACVKQAYDLMTEHEWLGRAKRLEHQYASLSQDEKAAGFGESRHHVELIRKEYLDALLDVSHSALTSTDWTSQAITILDRIVAVFGAQRAYLFMKEHESSAAGSEIGRDAHGNTLKELTGYSRTVVNKVFQEGKPLVVAGTEDAELIGSRSAVAHDLRSIMAAPLAIGKEVRGVVYLDSSAVTGIFNQSDFELLVALANHIAIAWELGEKSALEVEKAILAKDLAVSETVQTLLLPKKNHDRIGELEFLTTYLPASVSGGDWWNYHSMSGNKARLLVGDVTGHGVGAAMVTAAVTMGYHLLRECESATELMRKLDDAVAELTTRAYWMTLTLLELDLETWEMNCFRAGSPPLFLKENGQWRLLNGPATLPIGSGHSTFHHLSFPFAPNSELFVFTDGISELSAQNGRPLGLLGLRRLLERLDSPSLAERQTKLLEQLRLFSGERPAEDDITFTWFRRGI